MIVTLSPVLRESNSTLQSEWNIEQDTILEPSDVAFDLPNGTDSAALTSSFDSLSQRPLTIPTEDMEALGNYLPSDHLSKVCFETFS